MLPASFQRLVDSFSELPGVGRKTAERYAYFLLRSHRSLSNKLGETLKSLQDNITLCDDCFMICEKSTSGETLCKVCINGYRDHRTICVVEHIFDAEAIERSGEYRGVYHILHGRISPLDQVAPEDIKIGELITRIERVKEVGLKNGAAGAFELIIATNPSSEGEATALYLQKILKPMGLKITRIATGIPMGADLEYADEITLARALKGRYDYD